MTATALRRFRDDVHYEAEGEQDEHQDHQAMNAHKGEERTIFVVPVDSSLGMTGEPAGGFECPSTAFRVSKEVEALVGSP